MGATLDSRINDIIWSLGPSLDKAVEDSANELRDDVEVLMMQPKHGRVYKAKKTHLTGAATHQASAPGEAPAIESGDLHSSIRPDLINRIGSGAGVAAFQVGTGSPYAVGLEMGTARVAARPFFTISSELIWPDFVHACEEAILRAIGS